MSKFFENNLITILLAINCYFLFSISNSLKEASFYSSDLRACSKMKAFNNNKESSELYRQKAAVVTNVPVKFIDEYCKKLTKQNLF
tara:strand:- start:263 stop:520 length:258 start_codon:yes stop_codon:yes gene_type:complete